MVVSKASLHLCLLLSLAFALIATSACDSSTPSSSNTAATATSTPAPSSNGSPAAPAPPTAVPTPGTTTRKASSGATGTLTVTPNPILACEASGMGAANLSWNFASAQLVEVRMGAPDGALIAQAGAQGSKTTGKFVGPGTVFYLQDATNNLPRTAANTMATVTVGTTTNGCR